MKCNPTYYIIRFYDRGPSKVMATGLTLDKAKEWCSNPETSSRTAQGGFYSDPTKHVQWFDGFKEGEPPEGSSYHYKSRENYNL